MYCPNCDMRVETDTRNEREGGERFVEEYRGYDVEGPHPLKRVGNHFTTEEGYPADIGCRIDYCANCADVLRVKTYLY